MQYTVHEAILSYMNLSENRKQVGYPQLHEAASMSWYQLFKKTNESIVRKWVDVEKGFVKYPCSLENLLGVYVVDSCGELAALYEDNAKNIIEKPKKRCECSQCAQTECLCPVIQDTIVQADVQINGETYTNKTVTRVLKSGDIVEEIHQWVPKIAGNGTISGVQEVASQSTRAKLDVLPCGCLAATEENTALLTGCGCVVECSVPYLRERYPALYGAAGYYKKDEIFGGVRLFDTEGKKSRLTQVLVVFQSDGSDMLVPAYARPALIGLLDWTRKMYSPSFDGNDRRDAKRNFTRLKNEMLKFLNPIPWEWSVQTGEYPGKLAYRGVHSDFIEPFPQPPAPAACVTTPPANITNISYGVGARKGWLKEIVDGGDPGSPVSGLGTYQDNRLKLLGVNSNDRVAIIVDTQQMVNWGQAKSFDLDKSLGEITFMNGYTWQPLSSLEIDLDQ